MNLFSKYFKDTIFNETFEYDDEINREQMIQNDEIRTKIEKKDSFYKHVVGGYHGECNDFTDLSGGLNTNYHEIKVLEYIHFKMSNLRDYFYEIMIDKEPTFELPENL